MPVVFDVVAFARFELGYISITVLAAPAVLGVPTLARLELGIVEITVVASPAILGVATLARLELGDVPVSRPERSEGAFLHGVTGWIAHMTGSAGPMVLDVVTLRT